MFYIVHVLGNIIWREYWFNTGSCDVLIYGWFVAVMLLGKRVSSGLLGLVIPKSVSLQQFNQPIILKTPTSLTGECVSYTNVLFHVSLLHDRPQQKNGNSSPFTSMISEKLFRLDTGI